jgi:hypothetical protein
VNIYDIGIVKQGSPGEILFKEELLSGLWFRDGIYCRSLEIKILSWFLHQIQGDYLEIGINRGATALNICRNNPDHMIYGVDLLGETTMCNQQRTEQPRHENVAEFCRDEQNFRLMLENSWHVRIPESVKMVFIDADHTYEAVKNDTENVLEQMKKGYIFWHDFHNHLHDDYLGVTKYLMDLSRERQVYYFKNTWLAFMMI